MPHKDDGKGWNSGPGLFWDKPDFAASLMTVISSWAMVEQNLAQLYAELYAKKYSQLQPGWSGYDSLGHAVFSELESIHMRIRVFQAILDHVDLSLKSRFKNEVEPYLRAGAKARNRIAHATWWNSEKYPNGLTMLSSGHERISYSLNCVAQEQEIVNVARDKLASYREYTINLNLIGS